jgi:hypothetical protein
MGKTNRNKEMAKPLSFKDFITVDYTQTGDRVQATNAKKRKQDTATGNTGEAVEMEALDFQQRRAKARSLKKNKAKIAMGRRRAEKRTASQDVIKKRARKGAINLLFKKLSKGKSRNELPPARRQEIEKRLEKMKPKIDMIARKILPQVRKLEKERKANKAAGDSKE